jgi:hypothetical protein
MPSRAKWQNMVLHKSINNFDLVRHTYPALLWHVRKLTCYCGYVFNKSKALDAFLSHLQSCFKCWIHACSDPLDHVFFVLTTTVMCMQQMANAQVHFMTMHALHAWPQSHLQARVKLWANEGVISITSFMASFQTYLVCSLAPRRPKLPKKYTNYCKVPRNPAATFFCTCSRVYAFMAKCDKQPQWNNGNGET